MSGASSEGVSQVWVSPGDSAPPRGPHAGGAGPVPPVRTAETTHETESHKTESLLQPALSPLGTLGAHWHRSQLYLTEITASNVEIGIFLIYIPIIFLLIAILRQRAGALPLDESPSVNPKTRKPNPACSVMETDTPARR